MVVMSIWRTWAYPFLSNCPDVAMSVPVKWSLKRTMQNDVAGSPKAQCFCLVPPVPSSKGTRRG